MSVRASGSNQRARSGGVQAAVTVGNNWILSGGLESGRVPGVEENEFLKTSAGYLGIGSDPLADLFFNLSAESWRLGDQVRAAGGRLAIAWNWRAWTFELNGGQQQITFAELPKLIWPEGESRLTSQTGGLSLDYFATRNLSFRVNVASTKYDKPLSQYAEGLRVRFISPSVLTSVADLATTESRIGATYILGRFDVGVDLGAYKSALDNVRTRSLGLNGGYKLNRRWAGQLSAIVLRPENSTEDSAATIGSSLAFTYTW